MKHLILTILLTLSILPTMAEGMGKWKIYSAYNGVEAVDSIAPDCLFVLSSGNIYRVNERDWSVTTYDRLTGLTDCGIASIAWNRQARCLVIVYENSNIDLMTQNGDVTNVPDLYNKSTTLDKTVNGIDISGQYAYVSTGFGVVKLDAKQALVSESYILNKSILQVSVKDGYIYAKAKDRSILRASLGSNLVDHSQWAVYTGSVAGIFPDKTLDKALAERIGKMRPDGPRQARFGNMTVKNDRLYAVLGNAWDNPGIDMPHIYDIKDDKWTILSDDDGAIKDKTGVLIYSNFMAIDVNPSNADDVFVAARYGVYEFLRGQFVKIHDAYNTPITPAAADLDYLILPSAMRFGTDGTMWVYASQAIGKQGLFSLSKTGEWKGYDEEKWVYNNISLGQAKNMFFDSKGRLWWCNNHWWKPSLNCYDPAADKRYSYSTFTNEDGTTLDVQKVRCAAEDREGNIWIGTNAGPLMLERENIGDDSKVVWNQVKVPRNDGTNFADYLLSGVDITCMAVDAANRKWFGSDGNGVYVIGSDDITQEYNFTRENSPLPSDNVMGITIDNARGDVYIGTSRGLCSYRSDASEPADVMSEDDVYAYPNPVTPDYNGPITVKGLSYDADIKVTTTNGVLVAEGRSNGGTFTWDGNDLSGRRVASGIYMVCAATSDGKSGVVTRIAVVN